MTLTKTPNSELPLDVRRVEGWWIVRGRHGTGFHRYDALNCTAEEAQARAQTLLPTITDAQVQAMHEMMTAPAKPRHVWHVLIGDERYAYAPSGPDDARPWTLNGERFAMPWPAKDRPFTGDELRAIMTAVLMTEGAL
jgi:hypothetical protein